MRQSLRARSAADMPVFDQAPEEVETEDIIVPESETIIVIDDEPEPETINAPDVVPPASRNPFMKPLQIRGTRLRL